MRRYIRIMRIFMGCRIKSQLEYRGAMWSDFIFYVFGYGTQLALIYLLINRFETLGDWGPYEVMLLYSMSILSYTLGCAFFMGPAMGLTEKIREGHFDQSLTKPLNPLAYEIAANFSGRYLFHTTLGIVMISIPIIGLGIVMTPEKILVLILSMIGGAMIQGGVWLLFSSASFFLVGDNPLVYDLFVRIRETAEMPISIFPAFVQIIMTVIVPFAFVTFFPAQHLLDKDDFLMFSPVLQYLSPLVGVITLLVAGFVWLRGVNHYKSSGS